jgi:xylose isomerase
MEPTKHQYDYDSETVIGFLRHYGLDKDFKLNIEVNHATLAGHTFEHELQVAVDAGLLGSIDANRGDYQNGWDTDQFPVDYYDMVQAWLVLFRLEVWEQEELILMLKSEETLLMLKICSFLTFREWMFLQKDFCCIRYS